MRLFTDHQLSIRQHWRLGCVLLLCFGGVAHSGGALGQSQNPYLADQGTSGLKAQGLGYGHHSDHQNSTTHSRFNPANLILTGDPDANNANSNTPLATLAGSSTITSATLASHSGALKNRFDRSRMTRELRAQTDATQDFGRTLNQIDQGIAAQRAALKSAYQQGKLSAADYQRKDRKWRTLTLASASIGAGLGAPSTSIAGIAAAAASPLAAQQIGTVFKTKAAQNPDGKASNSDRTLQALAHGLLAAGVAAAGGNDALSAGLAAAGAEASAPLLAQGFYGTDKPQNLSEEQQTTLKSVAALGGAALGASRGDSSTITAGQLAENAVKNNALYQPGQLFGLNPSDVDLLGNAVSLLKFELSQGKTLEDAHRIAQDYLYCKGCKNAVEIGMEQAAVLLADTALDLTPIIGDIKGFAEAESTGDYIFAGIGLIPLAGDAAKEMRTARKAYEAAKVRGDVRGMKQALQDSSDVVRTVKLNGSVAKRQAGEYSGKATAGRVEEIEESVTKERKVHKNSRAYDDETHVYAVRNPDGSINKIGESAQGVRLRDGASKRAEQQVRKLNREFGPGHTSDIRKTFPNKDAARTYETNLIERYRRMYGQDTFTGNKTNRL